MKITDFRDNGKNPPRIVCLGNFDGVHLGHMALLNEAKRKKEELSIAFPGVCCGVLTFTEPSHGFLMKDPPPHITDSTEKAELFRAAGMDFLITLDFGDVRDMTPETFVREILIGSAGCVSAVCGYNFRFGKDAVGDPAALTALMNGRASVIPPVIYDGEVISSTAIRSAALAGNVEKAAAMLGRPLHIVSNVIHGKALGASLGFATINQPIPEKMLIPAPGVYITSCKINGHIYPSITNLGTRPTFDDGLGLICETHIIGYSGNAYGESAETSFYRFLRPERRFSSADELTAEIRKNIEEAKEFFRS